MKNCFIIILLFLFGCTPKQSPNTKSKKNILKKERSHIDSLYLVKTIPVVLVDSLQRGGLSFSTIFSEQLNLRGFYRITKNEESRLSLEFVKRFMPTDPVAYKRMMPKLEQNPNYRIDEMKRTRPFAQTIKILPCYPAKDGCIEIKRNNHPYAVKTRKWVFIKKEGMTDESFVSYIIDLLTATPQ